MTKFVEKFNNQPVPRATIKGRRYYATPNSNRLPRVTIILDKTNLDVD